MIGILFQNGTEIVEVRVNGTQVSFRSSNYGSGLYPIESLQLSKAGVIKEFPDLDGREDWKNMALKRFYAHIAKLKSEDKVVDYIIKDLSKFGFIPKSKQREGFRPEKIKWPKS